MTHSKTYYRKLLDTGKWEVGYIKKDGTEKPLSAWYSEERAIDAINRYEDLDIKIGAALERAIEKIKNTPELLNQLKEDK